MQALSRVQEFLGVPVMKLSSQHVKIHTRPLPDLVENWEDVSDMLNGTKYVRFLDDADYAKWCFRVQKQGQTGLVVPNFKGFGI